jgi:protein SCO1/2
VPEYALRGQLIAVSSDRREVSINHEDIPGFMPAMTMAYRVEDSTSLNPLVPGDLVSATLVVPQGALPYLINIKKTGHAELRQGTPTPKVMDVLARGDPAPDDPLVDQDGHRRHLSEWRGSAVALTFMYTRCPMPEFCPLIDRKFAEVQKTLAGDGKLEKATHLISVSFNPAVDTPGVLKAHAARLHADSRIWTFVTAPPATMTAFAARFGVSLIDDSRTNTITHNLRTAVIDPNGRLLKVHSGNDWQPEALVNDLRDAIGR